MCDWERQRRTGSERVLARFGSHSVLLQDQVFQLVCWAEQEGRGLPVTRDELPHRCDLRGAELSRSSTAAASLTMTVWARAGGVRTNWLHTQICGTCRHKCDKFRKTEHRRWDQVLWNNQSSRNIFPEWHSAVNISNVSKCNAKQCMGICFKYTALPCVWARLIKPPHHWFVQHQSSAGCCRLSHIHAGCSWGLHWCRAGLEQKLHWKWRTLMGPQRQGPSSWVCQQRQVHPIRHL